MSESEQKHGRKEGRKKKDKMERKKEGNDNSFEDGTLTIKLMIQ